MQTAQGGIVSTLQFGKDRAMSCGFISMICGVDKRDVRKAVEYVRCQSDPDDPATQVVVSCRKGYYLADTLREALAFYRFHRFGLFINGYAVEKIRVIIKNKAGLDPDLIRFAELRRNEVRD